MEGGVVYSSWEFHHSEILEVTFGSGGIILHLILSARNLEGILKTLLNLYISTRMFQFLSFHCEDNLNCMNMSN